MRVSLKELRECITDAVVKILSESAAPRFDFSDLDTQLANILAGVGDPKARSARRAANVDGNLGLPQIKDKKESPSPEQKRGRGRPKKGEEVVKAEPKPIYTQQDDDAMLTQLGSEEEPEEDDNNIEDTFDDEENEESFDSYASTRSTEDLLQEKLKWIQFATQKNTPVDNIRPYRRVNGEINRRLKMKCEFAEFECEPMSGYKINKDLILSNLEKDGIDIEQLRFGAEDREIPMLSTSNVTLYPNEVEPTWKNVGVDSNDSVNAGEEDTNDLNFSFRMGKDKSDENDPQWRPNRYW